MSTVLRKLQVLRFVAAAMVLISHLQHVMPSVSGIDLHGYRPWTPVWFAGGVDIFFVISGFIMYSIAGAQFGQPGAAGTFIARRLLRIVPPYWLFTTAMLMAALLFRARIAHPALSSPHVLASYLFVPWRNPYGRFYPVLILGWTLNFEMLFYALFALGLRWPQRQGLALIGAALAALALCGALLDVRATPLAFWGNPIVLEFLFGVALAVAVRRGLRCSMPIAAASVALGVLSMVWLQREGIPGTHWAARCLWMGLPALLLCAGVLLLEADLPATGPWRVLVLGGDASFALYLSHPFTLAVVAALWPHLGLSAPGAYLAIAGFAACGCAVGIHRYVERPMLSALTARLLGASRRPRAHFAVAGVPT